MKKLIQIDHTVSQNIYVICIIYMSFNPFVTSGTYMSHSQRVFSSYAALHTVSFVHGCFVGKCILTGSTE